MLQISRVVLGMLVAAVWCVLAPTSACATGTIQIHHADGDVNTYRDVDIRVLSGSLFLTTDDGNGTIVVTKAACSYQGQVIVCYPILAALVQGGKSSALALKRGTIYLNYTDETQQMSSSTTKIPADSVVMGISLMNGSTINLHGKIDQVVKQ